MAGFQSQTMNVVGGTGYVFTLPRAMGNVTLLSRVECYVQLGTQGVSPATPTVAAIPSAGTATNFYHMLPNETVSSGIDPNVTQQYEFVQYVAVWAVSSGNLTCMGVARNQ